MFKYLHKQLENFLITLELQKVYCEKNVLLPKVRKCPEFENEGTSLVIRGFLFFQSKNIGTWQGALGTPFESTYISALRSSGGNLSLPSAVMTASCFVFLLLMLNPLASTLIEDPQNKNIHCIFKICFVLLVWKGPSFFYFRGAESSNLD